MVKKEEEIAEKVDKKDVAVAEEKVAEEKNKESEKMDEISKKTVVDDKKEKKKDETVLTNLEDYIKTAAYLGTKVITPTMRKYVYRRRLDGLAILNTLLVDKKLKDLIDFVVQFKPDDWTLICKRESGWRAAKMFSELTGVRLFTKKYPSGVLTNSKLPNFFETKMLMICDPWLDKNALKDAKNIRIPVAGICDTNNHTKDIDVLAIANNKSTKSLGLIFWLLSREYMKTYNIKKPLPTLEDFVGEKLVLEEPKKKKKKKEDALKSDEKKIEDRMKELAEKADCEVKSKLEDVREIKVSEGASEGV